MGNNAGNGSYDGDIKEQKGSMTSLAQHDLNKLTSGQLGS